MRLPGAELRQHPCVTANEMPGATTAEAALDRLPDELRDRALRERETAVRLADYLAEHHGLTEQQ